MPAPHSFNEAQTRYGIIDPQLTKRGWNLADRRSVSLEVPVNGYDAAPVNGITDYCLYRSNGEVLAVIEAKRTRRMNGWVKSNSTNLLPGLKSGKAFGPVPTTNFVLLI